MKSKQLAKQLDDAVKRGRFTSISKGAYQELSIMVNHGVICEPEEKETVRQSMNAFKNKYGGWIK